MRPNKVLAPIENSVFLLDYSFSKDTFSVELLTANLQTKMKNGEKCRIGTIATPG
jgi:hypothetical protein